jgi:hypothetical protein
LAVGGSGALVLTRVLGKFLFEVKATDPARSLSVAAVLALTGIIADLSPARSSVLQDQTVHVEGIVGDSLGAVILHAEVHFVGDNDDREVTADGRGFYQTDLSLGAYTMTAALLPSGPSHISSFTNTSAFFGCRHPPPSNSTPPCITLVPAMGFWGGKDAEESYKDTSGGEDSSPFPSRDAVPLRLDIRYVRRVRKETVVSDCSNTIVRLPVQIAYSLFALRADFGGLQPNR